MDLTWILIMIAPPLVLFAAIFIVFLWASKAKAPAFVRENEKMNGNSNKTQN